MTKLNHQDRTNKKKTTGKSKMTRVHPIKAEGIMTRATRPEHREATMKTTIREMMTMMREEASSWEVVSS